MSFFSTENALAKIEFDGFGGIDTSKPASLSNNAARIENFRILPDGSLQRRNCFCGKLDIGKKVRAICRCFIDGEYVFYALADNIVYKYEHSGETIIQIGRISSSSGRASIFQYMGAVYLIDGRDIYEIKTDKIATVNGYAPLIGKDWDTKGQLGEFNEPFNLLSQFARISYSVKDPSAVLLGLPYYTMGISAITVNGVRVDSSRYYINWDNLAVSINEMNKGDTIMLYLSVDGSAVDRNEIIKNTEAYVFGGISNSRVFLWGGEEKNVVFPSGSVSTASLIDSQLIYPNTSKLYFPKDANFIVGDGNYDVKAVGRHYDRLLIFTEGDTWMADSDISSDHEFSTMRINTAWGCSAVGGVSKAGNDPVTISRDRIMRWRSNTDELDDCNAYCISDGISSLLYKDFFTRAIVYEDKYNGEVLFRDPNDIDGRVYVYNSSSSKWYTYSGINADIFFEGPDGLAFVSGSEIYFFDKSLECDKAMDGTPKTVSAVYESNEIDFGMPERSKRFMAMNLVGELGENEELEAVIKNERETINKCFRGLRSYLVESFYSRIPSARFRRGSIRLSTSSNYPTRIFKMTVTVKP